MFCSCQRSRSRTHSAAAQSAAAEESKTVLHTRIYTHAHMYVCIYNLSKLLLLKALFPGHPKNAYRKVIGF